MASEAANAKNFVVSGTPGIKTAEFPKSSKKISTITATATKSRSLSNLIEKVMNAGFSLPKHSHFE